MTNNGYIVMLDGNYALCEVCLQPIEPDLDSGDDLTWMCDVCERIGFCEACSAPDQHDCDEATHGDG